MWQFIWFNYFWYWNHSQKCQIMWTAAVLHNSKVEVCFSCSFNSTVMGESLHYIQDFYINFFFLSQKHASIPNNAPNSSGATKFPQAVVSHRNPNSNPMIGLELVRYHFVCCERLPGIETSPGMSPIISWQDRQGTRKRGGKQSVRTTRCSKLWMFHSFWLSYLIIPLKSREWIPILQTSTSFLCVVVRFLSLCRSFLLPDLWCIWKPVKQYDNRSHRFPLCGMPFRQTLPFSTICIVIYKLHSISLSISTYPNSIAGISVKLLPRTSSQQNEQINSRPNCEHMIWIQFSMSHYCMTYQFIFHPVLLLQNLCSTTDYP